RALNCTRDVLETTFLRPNQLRQPEVEQFRRPFPRDHDVRRLQVAVQDAAPMRGFERADDRQRKTQGLFDGHRPVQRLALDIFEHQVARADVMNLTDVWVAQRSNRLRFMLKSTET